VSCFYLEFSAVKPRVKLLTRTYSMSDTLGKQTFGLTKKDYTDKLSRIIENHRVNSQLIGEPKDFVLRSCRVTPTWGKLSTDPEVKLYLRNVDIAGGMRVKMLSLERGGSKQPVPKKKVIDFLYPPKKIATSASSEEKHFNAVKAAMRGGVSQQLKDFRDSVSLPATCYLTGKNLRRGMKTDVDHVGLSFAEIADSFVRLNSLTYVDISLVGPPTAKEFKDKALWKEWKSYHLAKANFSLVCSSANRSKGCEGYKTSEEVLGSFSKCDAEDLSLDF